MLPPMTDEQMGRAVRAVRVSLVARWDGAALDRLLAARHSAMHEELARLFSGLPDWVTSPEVTFAV